MTVRLRSVLRIALAGSTCALVASGAVTALGQQSRDTGTPTTKAAIVLPQPKFQIPFTIDPTGVRPAAVQLWVSTDAGQSWQMHGTQTSDSHHFEFRAAAQGEYLFQVQSVDKDGDAYPSNSRPLRVVVDTTKPQVDLKADVDVQGNLTVDLQIVDEHLRPESAELRIRTDRDSHWRKLAVEDLEQVGSSFHNSTSIALDPCREIALVFRVEDAAGNSGEATFQFDIPRTAGLQSDLTLASTGGDGLQGRSSEYRRPPANRRSELMPTPGATAWEPSTRTTASRPAAEQTLETLRTPGRDEHSFATGRNASPADVPQYPGTASTSGPRPGQLASIDSLLSLEPAAPAAEELPLPPAYSQAQSQAGSAANGAARQGAGQVATPRSGAAQQPSASRHPQSSQRSETFQCNSRAFSLDYSVESLGGTSLSDVQLWGTEDGGRTWQQWGTDPDRVSPFDVKVGNDGRFGFRMVIVGANGVVSNRPKPGDTSDVSIEVDTAEPAVGISRAVYGKGQSEGSLVIDFSSSDPNLISRPASLAYRGSNQQPWQLIANNLSASDSYLWKPPVDLPEQIYLRVESIDQAGNVGSYELERPIDIRGLAPRGRIHRVRPIR